MGVWRGVGIWLVLGLGCAASRGQALAHKNWAGSGLVVQPWWVGAELYQIDPISFQDSDGDGFGDLNGISDRLDYLTALGVDGLVLSPMPVPLGAAPFDKSYGTEEDFGRLVGEATRRRMRVLVDLPLSGNRTTAETVAAARFWLTRGVAGLRLVNDRGGLSLSPAQRLERVRALRRLCQEFAGQRVLMGEEAAPVAVARGTRHEAQGVELVLDPGLGAAGVHAEALRSALAADARVATDATTPVLAIDGEDKARSAGRLGDGVHDAAIAKVMAAVLLGSRGAPLIYFGQEVGMSGAAPAPMPWGTEKPFTTGVPWIEAGPTAATANVTAEESDADSLLNWYRKLGVLRHANAALRGGTEEMLRAGDGDALAWVRRARLGEGDTPDVVVVANCSGRFVSVSVETGVGVRVLRTLAATFAADSAVSTRGIAVPPYGVFVGEIERKAGLETVVLPPKRRR